MRPNTLLLTAAAMAFFAANSVLARLALRAGAIDAAAFTAVRVVSGAAALALLAGGKSAIRHGSFRSGLALFAYAIAFSLAYLSLNAGTGALILFAAVQITMLAGGDRPHAREWLGLAAAFGGFVYLVAPGLTAPSPGGVALMALAGVAWGCYSLAAKGVASPIAATAGNFARALPWAAGALLVAWTTGQFHATWTGLGLAALSGALTSGIGYAIWYLAMKDLRTSFAAIVQLTVPLLAAAAGVILLGEPLTWRLVLSSIAILGGVGIAVRRN